MADFLPNLPGRTSFILPKGTSRLMCFYAGQRQLKAVRESIIKFWPKGLDSEKVIAPQCIEFKLHDNPFQLHDTGANIVAVMNLYTSILSRYYRYGWKLVSSTLVSDRSIEDPMLIFRKVVNPSSYPIVSVGIAYFHIHLENAPEDLTTIVEQLINNFLKHDIKHIDRDSETSTTFKLKGLKGLGEHETWSFMKSLLTVLHNNHYVVYGTLPLKYHVFDMIFFHYVPNHTEQELFTMIIKGQNTLQLHETDVCVNNAIEETVQRVWADGYQKKYEDDCLELKLKGRPFDLDDEDKAVATDALFASLLEKLASIGYFVASSFTQIGSEKQFMFRKEKREELKPRLLCLSITDRSIRFINAPQEIIEAANQVIEDMRLVIKEDAKITPGCTHKITFKKKGILFDIDGTDTYQAQCLLAALTGSFTELRYHFVMSADLQRRHYIRPSRENRRKYNKGKAWFFMFDEEEVAVKQHLKIESQSRSPSPHRNSGCNSPSSRSPRSHISHHSSSPNRSPHPHNRHHAQSQHHRHSPRLSPMRFRGEPPTAPFLHSGETHLLPSPLVDAPPSYDEIMATPPYETLVSSPPKPS